MRLGGLNSGAIASALILIAGAAGGLGLAALATAPPSWLVPDDIEAASLDAHGGHEHGDATALRFTLGGPYTGPSDADAVLAACPGSVVAATPCYTRTLNDLLAARGSEAAFDVLDEMSKRNVDVALAGHVIAHDMGAQALRVYASIDEALRTCSHKVFQGCFHGAIQAHFRSLDRIDERAVATLCPTDDPFRSYVCLHGVGHGLMLATGYALNESLGLCDATGDSYASGSCHGGVFMQNFAGWKESREPAVAGHASHGDKPAERYWIDPGDLNFPCNIIDADYQWSCWYFHTSVVLTLNGQDFDDANARCRALNATLHTACYRSLGRDASVYRNYDATAASQICMSAPASGQGPCVRGIVANSILYYATPDAGIPVCRAIGEAVKLECYAELAIQGRTMAPDRMAEVCASAEPEYVQTCQEKAHT